MGCRLLAYFIDKTGSFKEAPEFHRVYTLNIQKLYEQSDLV